MRISSQWTYFYKSVFPALWFGFLAFFILMAVTIMLFSNEADIGFPQFLPFLFAPTIMTAFGYFLFKFLIFDLVDEMTDEGDTLVARNGNHLERIALDNIMNINSSVFMNPPRITLMLRQPCGFGDMVSFMPPARFSIFSAFSMHPIAADLIRRVDATRVVNEPR